MRQSVLSHQDRGAPRATHEPQAAALNKGFIFSSPQYNAIRTMQMLVAINNWKEYNVYYDMRLAAIVS